MSKEVENHQNIRNGLQLQLCKIQKDSEISEAAMRCVLLLSCTFHMRQFAIDMKLICVVHH